MHTTDSAEQRGIHQDSTQFRVGGRASVVCYNRPAYMLGGGRGQGEGAHMWDGRSRPD